MTRKLLAGLLLLTIGISMIGAGWHFAGRAAAAQSSDATNGWSDRVIRLHVVANSDSQEDQDLKRAVRDAILAAVTPKFVQAVSQAEAGRIIADSIPEIQAAAERTVAEWGKTYSVRVVLGRYPFPGKAYGPVYLPAGEYAALKVLIGEAKGANWWCVLFPPLCFLDWSAGVVLEPKPGTDGRETVSVQRPSVALLDEEKLEQLPVQAHSKLLDWAKRLRVVKTGRFLKAD